jgi:hypothetical protein
VADTPDLDTLDGFETIDRPQVVVPPQVDNTTRAVTIAGGTVRVKGGRAQVKVSCPSGSAHNCTGSISLLTAHAVRFKGVKAVLQLGSVRFNLAPGASSTVTVKLARGVERLADRRGHLKVVAVASTGNSGGIASSSQRATLALSRPHAARHPRHA